MTIPGIQIRRPPSAPTENDLPVRLPVTADERRADIDRIAERINDIVRHMCNMSEMPGTSAEVRDKAIAAFHERIAVAEKHLTHIRDKLRLE
jgi:hypothetical protein